MHLYQTAVDAVDGRRLVQLWCRDHPSAVFTHCVAIGKAAAAMLQGALDSSRAIDSALLITTRQQLPGGLERNSKIKVIESAHPVPDQSSLEAGDALLNYLGNIPEQAPLLVLISGGASSLVEVPLDDVSLPRLQQVNEYLLASGKNIHKVNFWRKQFSKIKGGGLLCYVGHLQCTQLIISDVFGNDPAVIGSGMLVQSGKRGTDSDEFLQSLLPGYPRPDTACKPVATHIIASNETAISAVVDEAAFQGVDQHRHNEFISGDAVRQGRAIGAYLRNAPACLHVWGGETTVELPDHPGLGGRNQSMALSLAAAIEDVADLSVLVAGTDGIDGNTGCAGAVVSGASMRVAKQMGYDATAELNRANAGMVLMAIGDTFKPGPTNTNVMDLVIAYKRA